MRQFLIVVMLLLSVEGMVAVGGAIAGSRGDTRSVALANATAEHRQTESQGGNTPTRELAPELIAGAIQTHLEGEWSGRIRTVSVALLEPSDVIQIPQGIVDVRVLPTSTEEGLGRRSFQVAVTVARKPWKTLQVVADISATVEALVLTRSLKTDEVIEAGDLKSIKVRALQLNHPFVTNRDEVIGKSAVRPLPPDTPLRSAFVKLPLVVKKGDRVMIEVRRGGLSIQTYGVTKSSGQVGQMIMVANIDSGRELRAKVVAPSLVQVEF